MVTPPPNTAFERYQWKSKRNRRRALLLEDLLEVLGRLLFAPDQVECEAERLEHVDLPRSSPSLITASEVAGTSRQDPKG